MKTMMGDTFTKVACTCCTGDLPGFGSADAEIEAVLPEVSEAGQALIATAEVNTPEVGQSCIGYWYVDGEEVAFRPLTRKRSGNAGVSL